MSNTKTRICLAVAVCALLAGCDSTDYTLAPISGVVTLDGSPSHPIFAGIALDGTNTTVNPYAGIVLSPVDSAAQRGTSIPIDSIAAGGQLLASIGTAADPAFGGFAIAKWSPGATTTTTAANILGGHRLAFIGGSREADGVSSETAGILDLTDDGATMFLNAVDFMLTVPEPSSATLLLLAVAGFARLRRR